MSPPTRTDLELNDTPALAVLARRARDFPDVDPGSLQACQDLLRVAKRSLAAFSSEFNRHGLSPGRYAVLMELYQTPAGLAPSEIAERIGVTRATITGRPPASALMFACSSSLDSGSEETPSRTPDTAVAARGPITAYWANVPETSPSWTSSEKMN